MKDVILLGCDGYLGHALTLRLLESGYRVIGADDFQRRENVKEMESFSAIEIEDPDFRHKKFKRIFGEDRFHFLEMSIATKNNELEYYLNDLIENDIAAIVNLAQQPSAPYSFKSQKHADNNQPRIMGGKNTWRAIIAEASDPGTEL